MLKKLWERRAAHARPGLPGKKVLAVALASALAVQMPMVAFAATGSSSDSMAAVLHAYGDFLRQKASQPDDSGLVGSRFRLTYIDEDEIPELVLNLDYSAGAKEEIYTYKNASVVEVISSEHHKYYGCLSYAYQKNSIEDYRLGRHGAYEDYIYSSMGQNGEAVVVLKYGESGDDMSGIHTHWEVNDTAVSQSAYNKAVNDFKASHPYEYLNAYNYDASFDITSANIEKMKSNYQSVVVK